MLALLDRVDDDGRALILTGAAGVGKTVLLDFADLEATARDLQVLRGQGIEFEAKIGYLGLHYLLLPTFDRLDHLDPRYATALRVALGLGDGDTPSPLLVCNAVLALLEDLAAERPVLLCVDDLPWLDEASAGILGAVVRRLPKRVCFLGACRLDEIGFFDRRGLRSQLLGPLDPDSARALLRERYPDIAGSVLRRLLAESEGNPLALVELAAALSPDQRRALAPMPTVLRSAGDLQWLFATRIAELPKKTRDLLVLAALDGSGDLRNLERTNPGQDTLDSLAPAERARLVAIDEGAHRIAFVHPLTRSAVIDLSTGAERRRMHRVLAALTPEGSDRRAWHLAEASIGPDEEVAAPLESSAHNLLRRGDSVGAVNAMIRAADLTPEEVVRARRLAEAAAVGAAVTGQIEVANKLIADARSANPESSGSLAVASASAAVLMNIEGKAEAAHKILVAALERGVVSRGEHPETIIGAMNGLVLICHYMGKPEVWPGFRSLAEEIGTEVELPPLVRQGPMVLADMDSAILEIEDATPPTDILRLAAASPYTDRTAALEPALLKVIDDGRDGGAVTLSITALSLLGLDDFRRGRWPLGEERMTEVAELGAENGYRTLEWVGRFGQGLIAAGRGDLVEAEARAVEIRDWGAPRGVFAAERYSAHIRALAALSGGNFEVARRELDTIAPPGAIADARVLGETGALISCYSHSLLTAWDQTEALVHCDRPGAVLHVEAMRDADLRKISPRLDMVVTAAEALVSQPPEGRELLERALNVPGAEPWAFDRSRIRLALGELLRRNRAGKLAREHLAAAVESFERIGATPWAERARIELEATAAHKPRPVAGQVILTPQELEIAGLAARGLTNKEIGARLYLSHRTVSAHLYRIFPKLGISSRAMLRDALTELEGPDGPTPEHVESRQGSPTP
jgi:DNA-binding CsgD family transcriptional regulator